MKSIFITGVGINSEVAATLSHMTEINIDFFQEREPINNDDDLFEKKFSFHSLDLIKREDRSLLNNCAKLTIDSAIEAFTMAERNIPYSAEQKENFCIYIANESIENNFSSVENFSYKNRDEKDNILWKNLGKIKEFLNPLDMLRLLSTNPLYHISKVLGLHGGGYPIRRMSLSGLTALEEAYYSIPEKTNYALVVGTGDLKTPENICAFKKMSLLQTIDKKNGILPSFASAAVILEAEDEHINRKAYAEIISIHSLYQTKNRTTEDDWKKLYSNFPEIDYSNLTIICYNNGVQELASEEVKAMKNIFNNPKLYCYKQYFGYTGKANTIVDLITALSDRRIPPGSYLSINGLGMSVGLGYVLIRKLAHI